MIATNFLKKINKAEFYAIAKENGLDVSTQANCLASLMWMQANKNVTARYDDVRAWHWQMSGGSGFPTLSKSVRAYRGR